MEETVVQRRGRPSFTPLPIVTSHTDGIPVGRGFPCPTSPPPALQSPLGVLALGPGELGRAAQWEELPRGGTPGPEQRRQRRHRGRLHLPSPNGGSLVTAQEEAADGACAAARERGAGRL